MMASGPKPRGRRTSTTGSKRSQKAKSSMSDAPRGELIVIAKTGAGVRASRDGAPLATAANVGPLSTAFAPPNVNLVPLFGRPEERIRRETAPLAARAPGDERMAPDLGL